MKRHQLKTLLVWLLFVGGALWIISHVQMEPSKKEKVTFSEFIKQVQLGNVENVTYRGSNEIFGKFKPTRGGQDFETVGDTHAESYLNILRDKGLTPNYEAEPKP